MRLIQVSTIGFLAALAWLAGPARAAEPAVGAFTRQVVPVLSRLGCNAGACHGAVQGKNGFRLSLFGSDPVADHARLLRGAGGRRLDRVAPQRSLLLLKGTGQLPHEGGQRMQVGSSEYQVLHRWIAAGAPLDAVQQSAVTRLTVTPRELTGKPGSSHALRVEATYADGSTADVTQLCHFESRDTSVAAVSRKGQVTLHGAGDAVILARYGWHPLTAHVVVPRPGAGAFPTVKEHNFIDRHVLDKLRRLNLPPADLCDDALFLRRVSLDVTGALPEPDEVRAFLADRSPNRRARKIEQLLRRPGHSALWATKLCDLLRVRISYQDFTHRPEPGSVRRFYDWLRARLRENTPYDEIVARMVLSTSLEGRPRRQWIDEVVAQVEEDNGESTRPATTRFADRKTLDLYWHRFDSTGVKGAIQFSHQFLGLRLQCAECHRHPSDVWTQDDLLGFANFFLRLRANTGVLSVREAGEVKKRAGTGLTPAEKGELQAEARQLQAKARQLEADARAKKDDREAANRLRGEARRLQLRAGALTRAAAVLDVSAVYDTRGNPFGFARVTSPLGTQTSEHFRLLGQPSPIRVADDQDPRALVVAWLRRADNPFFARAIVNRVWAHYFGRGIVDPPDDLSPLNPATHPKLLQELSDRFIQNKYDLRWLHRTILESRTYQQSSQPPAASRGDTRNYAYFYPRRLMAEIIVDALHHATGTSERYSTRLLPPGTKALEVPVSVADNAIANRFTEFAFVVLGRPLRSAEAVCDCEREAQPSLGQALFLANHPDVWKKVRAKEGRVARILAAHTDAGRRVDEVFLWALGRPPAPAERKLCLAHLDRAPSPRQGLEGVMWALINSKEFVLNR